MRLRWTEQRFEGLPHWIFSINEISPGYYRIKGQNEISGANLDITGTDEDAVVAQARSAAADMDLQTQRGSA